jgi:hypothetical protein
MSYEGRVRAVSDPAVRRRVSWRFIRRSLSTSSWALRFTVSWRMTSSSSFLFCLYSLYLIHKLAQFLVLLSTASLTLIFLQEDLSWIPRVHYLPSLQSPPHYHCLSTSSLS